jgi:predicted ester cyclase
MSTEVSKMLAQNYFEKLINVHNLAAVDELFDPNISFHDPAIPGGSVHGLKAVTAFFTTFFAAFPDVHFTIEDLLAQDDKVSARFTWRGTHRSKFLGIIPTHKQGQTSSI